MCTIDRVIVEIYTVLQIVEKTSQAYVHSSSLSIQIHLSLSHSLLPLRSIMF